MGVTNRKGRTGKPVRPLRIIHIRVQEQTIGVRLSATPSPGAVRQTLLDSLRRVDAPEFRPLQPAAVARDIDLAPACLTVQQLAGDSRFDFRKTGGAVARGA